MRKIIFSFLSLLISFSLLNPSVYASISTVTENTYQNSNSTKVTVLPNNVYQLPPTTVNKDSYQNNGVTQNTYQYIPDKYFPKPYNSGGITTNVIPGAVAGVYLIPGVGEVALVATGAVVVAGVSYYAGSKIYEKVRVYFAEKEAAEKEQAAEKTYQDAKKAGNPAATHEKKGPPFNKLGIKGKPRSSEDLYDTKGLKQRRYYDKNGNADEDIDYDHSNADNTHTFPHRHKWINGKRM